jgi:hypothetical protein
MGNVEFNTHYQWQSYKWKLKDNKIVCLNLLIRKVGKPLKMGSVDKLLKDIKASGDMNDLEASIILKKQLHEKYDRR